MRLLKNRRKNNVPAFTLIECCIVGALLCVLWWSVGHVQHFYRVATLVSTVDHLTTVFHVLASAARLRGSSTALKLSDAGTYRVNDGEKWHEHSLPFGIEWGVGTVSVYGPPSSPKTLVTEPIVGGAVDGQGRRFLTWDEHGMYTPATLYLHQKDRCAALSLSRAGAGIVRAFYWDGNRWRGAVSSSPIS